MTTDGPRITVVTVCLNAVASIERTLSSVVGQGYPRLEYVIVDGGSTDGTIDIIRRYETRLAAWSSEPDRGISDAFNKGIRRATGEVIGLVSADDYLPEGTLQRVAAAWLAAARPDVLYGNSLVVYPDGSGATTVHPDRDFSAVWRRTPVKHSSTWITRRAYERYGGYGLRWRLAMDYELILRFHLRGARFHYEDAVLGAFQLGGRNDVDYRAAARELRDISIYYGYPRGKAQPLFAQACVRLFVKKRLEARGRGLIRDYRSLSRRFSPAPP